MATLQSLGIGSGLDLNTLVSQLIAAERAPHEQRLLRQETRVTTQISALGTLKGALSAFKSALEPLTDADEFNLLEATVSREEVLDVTAGSDAAPGTYRIEVVALAQAHQLASNAFADGAQAVVGTGTLTITYGAKSFAVTIDEGNNTLDGIRDAINAAADNPGVRATLIHESGGTRLVISAEDTGAAHEIRVTQSGGDGGLAQLVYDPESGVTNLIQTQAAQDAHVRIAGFDHFSASNTVTGAIDGVTLTLKSAAPGSEVTLGVAYDVAGTVGKVKAFVEAYNSLHGQLVRLRSYTPATSTAGPLLGDSLLRSIEEQIGRELSSPVDGLTGSLRTLAAIGVTRTIDGKLQLDESRLKEALGTNRREVAALFGSEDGIAARLSARIEEHLDSTAGSITARNESLQKSLKRIEREKEALELRMEALEQRYIRQFTALDALLASLQSTSSYLAQQLGNLPKPGGTGT